MNAIDVAGTSVELSGQRILHDIDVCVAPGQIHALVGPNGAGKSTLLRTIATLIPSSCGSIHVHGHHLHRLSSKERARLVSFMPQDTTIPGGYKVRDVVALGRYAHLSRFGGLRQRDVTAIDEALDIVGVTHLADRAINTLSGGQRQLVVMAKCLAQEADVMLLDEPLSALDLAFQVEMLAVLKRTADAGRTVVVVVHDLNLAARHCCHITVLREGQVHASGTPQVLTEQLVADVYGVRAVIDTDPSGSPRITPMSKGH